MKYQLVPIGINNTPPLDIEKITIFRKNVMLISKGDDKIFTAVQNPNRWLTIYAFTALQSLSRVGISCKSYFRSVWTAVYQYFVKVNIDISCWYFSFFSIPKKSTTLIWSVRHINRSFASFHSQTVIAWQTERLTNARIKHQNNIIICLE